MMAYALISYALFTMHLGDLTPQEIQEIVDKEHLPNANDVYPIVFHNDRIVVYHSVVTAFFSVLMVLIGLTNFVKESKQEVRKIQLEELLNEKEPDKHQQRKIERLKQQINKKRPIQYEMYEPDEGTMGGGDV